MVSWVKSGDGELSNYFMRLHLTMTNAHGFRFLFLLIVGPVVLLISLILLRYLERRKYFLN